MRPAGLGLKDFRVRGLVLGLASIGLVLTLDYISVVKFELAEACSASQDRIVIHIMICQSYYMTHS